MKCSFAGFNIHIENNYGYTEREAEAYKADFPSADTVISVTKDDLLFENEKSDSGYSDDYLEHIAAYRKLAEWLPLRNAFVLHSAVFDVGGVGVAFAAHSGTGKTTHMLLWQKLLGEKMTVVNGDKPIIRFFDNEPDTPYAYGTPWNGKERLGCNMRTVVKHICFIERSENNYVEKCSPDEVINRIFNQVYMPKDPVAVANTIRLINRFINSCSVWKIHCNTDPSAANTAYSAVFGMTVDKPSAD